MSKYTDKMISRILIVAVTLTLTLAEQRCTEHPNLRTNDYTYTICTGTEADDFKSSREFCQESLKPGYDLVTFPSEEEYNFMIEKLNETVEDADNFRYFPGFYQVGNFSCYECKYNPETGKYYWITDTENQVTDLSDSYWQPFEELIKSFKTVTNVKLRQLGAFVIDINGKLYGGVSVAGGQSDISIEGNVICQKRGVPPRLAPPTQQSVKDATFQYWIIITVAAGVVVLGVVFAAIAYCIFKNTKRKNDQKFHKVPQADNHKPANQYSITV